MTLQILNKARRAAGLDPVSEDTSLSRGCFLHAKYLAINRGDRFAYGLEAHEEDSSRPGYTREGERAARNSVIGFETPVKSTEQWLGTFYHRIPLLDPQLRWIGIGTFTDTNYWTATLLECTSGLSGDREDKDIVYYPGWGQLDVPLYMAPELPPCVDPGPDYGFPITVWFRNVHSLTALSFRLSDQDGREVACVVSTPEKPASYWPQQNNLCAIPKERLKAGVTYRVKVGFNLNGKRSDVEYHFKTIAKPGQTR